MNWNWILIAFFLLVMGCATVPPPGEEPGPGEEPEPAPGPAPEPEPGEERGMGYPPGPDGKCSSRAAHPDPVYGSGLCYKYKDLIWWCQLHRYAANIEAACLMNGAGHDH